MPGIDYRRVRAAIPMRQVLELIGFEPISRRGDQLRGACPLSSCRDTPRRTFSVQVERGVFHCFTCDAGGNQLDLWALLHNVPLHEAAQDLCEQTRTPIPWLPTPPH